ncbi:Na(+)/H(+) antiporter subunit F1 [Fervidibacillus halotolerans]|uniref:Na(+)/H(+) antiporter subunit F1 n=1 Tax=Fervidibacillus halotolerans TaxID=2980027 RepID=A0A9E8LYW7_9BACI|nr:Na(+)/H(+) antiporter subunit F1 [Fervidibacillus halotolerans]WAA11825.1 Na(+)/H(+) antiporter subunit F1 [Fervidibacillus halotolerans]
MFNILLYAVLVMLSLSILGYVYRLIKGPTIPDRVVALDAIGITLVSITALVSIVMETNAFLDVILLIGILSFIGTAAFSKFLAKGVIFDRDRNS